MKSQLILCILIIFSVGSMLVESNERQEASQCYNRWSNQLSLSNACYAEAYNEREFTTAVHNVLLRYSGDDYAVRDQSDIYCPGLYRAVECTFAGYDEYTECWTPVEIAKNQQVYNQYRYFLDYICSNNSAIILQIVQDQGFATVYDNRNSMRCLNPIENLQNIDEETLTVPTEYCAGVDQVYSCYKNLVRDHRNQNLVRIADELNALHRQVLKCPAVN